MKMKAKMAAALAAALTAGGLFAADGEIRALMLKLGSNTHAEALWPDKKPANQWEWEHTVSDELRFDEDVWREVTESMAAKGFNMLVIGLAEGVVYPSHPELAVKGSWSMEKLKAELARLRGLGLEPIPKLNFAASHDTWLKEYHRMVSTKTYYKVCADVIRDVAEAFGRPRFFHLGYDEEMPIAQEKSAYMVVRQGELWWHDLEYLCGEVERNGARAWIWSDYLWHHRDEYLKRMPKKVLQSNWYYRTDFSDKICDRAAMEKKIMSAPWPEYVAGPSAFLDLEAAGYDQIPCGSIWASDANMGALVPFCRRRIGKERLKGFLMVPWLATIKVNREKLLKAVDVAAAAFDAPDGGAAQMARGDLRAKDLTPLKNVREAAGAPVEIVGVDGKAKMPVVVEDREDFVWAANFLADTIAEMTGARPEVVREKSGSAGGAAGPALFVGGVAAARKAGLSAPADHAEAFRVATKDGSVYFLGRGDYAVFDWCERVLDMRYYWPERPVEMHKETVTNRVYGKCVARQPSLAVPGVDYDDRPVFKMRHNWPYGRVAWNRVAKGGSSHRGMVNVHAPHKWYKEPDAKDHLEIFARNVSGERAADPLLCYGNPATLEYYKKRIEDHLAGRRDSGGIVSKSKVVTVSQWDCDVFCTCEHCKRLMRPELGATGSGSPVIWGYFTKELAKWLKAEHPDCVISILPYKNTCDVPEGLDFTDEGNVVAVLCTMPGLALLKDPECKKAEEGLIRRWAKATGNKVINWHYSCWPAEFTAAPYLFGETIARHYRDVRDVVDGTFINGQYPANRLSLSGYVWMRCLWNPDIDVQALYDEFARRMFGRAAAPMRRLMAMQEDGWNRKWENLRTSLKNVYEISWPRKDVLEMRRLLDEALALAAGDEKALARVKWYESGFDKFFAESADVASGTAFAPFMMKKAIAQPVVDGKLDDMCWSVAEPRSFVAATDRANPAPWAATEMRAVWTAKGVTFGFRCCDPATAAMDFDTPSGLPVNNDNVELFLDCSGSNGGDFRQMIVDRYGRKLTVPDATKWNTDGVKTAVQKGDGFWSMEVYFPYSCFAGFPGAKFPTTGANGVVWTGNATRWRVGDTKLPADKRVAGSRAEMSRLNTRFNKWNRDPAAFSNFVFVE